MDTKEKQTGKRKRGVGYFVGKCLLGAAVIIVVATTISDGARVCWDYLYGQYAEAAQAVRERLTTEVVVREVVPPSQLEVDQIIEEVSRKHGLNPIILRAIVRQESGDRMDRMRYEEKIYKSAKFPPYLNDGEKRVWASSIGPGQVIYVLWRNFCGWESLASAFDTYQSLDCSARILKRNLGNPNVQKLTSPASRLREALRMYNGTGEDAERYADTVMGGVAALMLKDLGEGV